jgi:hypothetical protein
MSGTDSAPRGKSAAARPPANAAAAAPLLARFAVVDGELAAVQARRRDQLTLVNSAADSQAGPLIAELKLLGERLQPWWDREGAALAKGRKSVQLGGCVIGYRTARARLEHGFANDAAAVEALRATRYGKQTTRLTYSLDRTATTKLVQGEGKTAEKLAELGFRVVKGEQFFVERVEQAGTVGAG